MWAHTHNVHFTSMWNLGKKFICDQKHAQSGTLVYPCAFCEPKKILKIGMNHKVNEKDVESDIPSALSKHVGYPCCNCQEDSTALQRPRGT